MKTALVVKFTNPVPGRERAAIAYARELDDFVAKKVAEGVCTEPKWFWSSTGENLWFVEGEYDALLGLLSTPEVTKFENKGMILMQSFSSELYVVGREESLVPFEEALAELDIT
jgi:hypothetical protein